MARFQDDPLNEDGSWGENYKGVERPDLRIAEERARKRVYWIDREKRLVQMRKNLEKSQNEWTENAPDDLRENDLDQAKRLPTVAREYAVPHLKLVEAFVENHQRPRLLAT
jgi:hypothetical protein